jgi:hypothetical protein
MKNTEIVSETRSRNHFSVIVLINNNEEAISSMSWFVSVLNRLTITETL